VVHRWEQCPGRALCWGRRKKRDPEEPADHALGRSRGGFGTKIHLLCDAQGHPLHFHLTAGQDHESTALETLLEGVDVENSRGEAIAKPVALTGDKGYRAAWIDEYLLANGIRPVIPSKENEDRDCRPVAWDGEAYRQRNIIERLIGWLKESRRIFSRFEKTAKNFGGMLKMAFIQRYLRVMGVLTF
jgi:transposase